MDAYNSTLALRAVRGYLPDQLTEDDLDRILESGRWTGSSKNSQPWTMVVVQDKDSLKELAKAGFYTGPIKNAVTVIVLVKHAGGGDFDIGRQAQNIMLAAQAVGVASCPVTLHREDRVRKLLGVPDGHGCRYAVALGYPDAEWQRKIQRKRRLMVGSGRRDLAAVVSKGSFK